MGFQPIKSPPKKAATMSPTELESNLTKAGVPDQFFSGLRDYILYGQETGSFLRSVLENDIIKAFRYADDGASHALRPIIIFLENYAPSACFGSQLAVDMWINNRGLEGIK
jgi:hypothetical protein